MLYCGRHERRRSKAWLGSQADQSGKQADSDRVCREVGAEFGVTSYGLGRGQSLCRYRSPSQGDRYQGTLGLDMSTVSSKRKHRQESRTLHDDFGLLD